MPHRLRVAFSTRMRLLNEDIAACDAVMEHIDNCKECKDDTFCAEGEKLYATFQVANARMKYLVGEDYVKP